MARLAAFIGHSFTEDDKEVVREFLQFFDRVAKMGISFTWEHAEAAEATVLSEKVKRLTEDKNLFIGICTAKEQVINPSVLSSGIFKKNILYAKKDEFRSKTSDWIIQEIGLAIGKGMDVILLLEEGVQKPGGLQGDLEYIPFDRREPSKSFNKILDMIISLSPRRTVAEVQAVESEPESKKTEAQETRENFSLEPSSDWGKKDYEYALFRAIATDDGEKENKILNAFSESQYGQEQNATIEFKARRIFLKQILRKGVEVVSLKELAQQCPDTPNIPFYLGKAYEEYNNFEEAAEQYQVAAEKSPDTVSKLSRLFDAAIAKRKAGHLSVEKWILENTRTYLCENSERKYALLSTLRTIAEIDQVDDKYVAYTEQMLALRPDEYELRFGLAYKYSEINNNELSLYHYSLIPHKERSSTVWNNIGVSYARLGLKSKAIQAYKKSEELGGTLAMSNLAHGCIEAGFLEEAENVCHRAIQIQGYDKQVGTAISSIKETRERESKEEDQFLEGSEEKRKFLLRYSQACIDNLQENIEGTWKAPECDLTVMIQGNTLKAQGTYKKEEGGFALLLGKRSVDTETSRKTIIVLYEGEFTGRSISYKKTTREEGVSVALLSGTSTHEGLMIIESSLNEICVYQKGTKDTEKFYKITRVE